MTHLLELCHSLSQHDVYESAAAAVVVVGSVIMYKQPSLVSRLYGGGCLCLPCCASSHAAPLQVFGFYSYLSSK